MQKTNYISDVSIQNSLHTGWSIEINQPLPFLARN